MNLIFDENCLLGSDIINDEIVKLNLYGNTITSQNKDLLIFHNNNFKFQNIKQIGRTQELIFGFDRKYYFFDYFDKNYFVYGLSIFQEFDEFENKNITYLYKFDKGLIDEFNEILQSIGIQYIKVLNYNNFSVVDGSLSNFEDIKGFINNAYKENDINKIFSFLFGMSIAYGKFDIKEDKLNSIIINIPLYGNLISEYDFFNNIIEYLFNRGIFVYSNKLKDDIGATMQLTINDFELLYSIGNFIKSFAGNLHIPKNTKNFDKKERLEKYIKDNFQDFYTDFESRFIKFVIK